MGALTTSPAVKVAERSRRRRATGSTGFETTALRVASVALLIGGWAVVALLIGTDVFPAPWNVTDQLGDLVRSGDFLGPLGVTVQSMLVCCGVALVVAVTYGVLVARSPRTRMFTEGVMTTLVFAPSLVIVFVCLAVFANHQTLGLVVISITAVAPQLALYVRDGMLGLDGQLVEMSRSLHVGTALRVRAIYLPHLVPVLVTVLRIGINNSWKVVALAEVFGLPGGLGFQIRTSYGAYDLPQVMAWLVIFIAFLLLVEQVIQFAESRWLQRR